MLQDLRRSEWLPPFDDDGMRIIHSEISDIRKQVSDLLAGNGNYNDLPIPVRVGLSYYKQCLIRDYRYLSSYIHHRLRKLRQLRWDCGPVLPERYRDDTISNREKDYFIRYNSILTDYQDNVGLDLTSDIIPPKDLFIQVRVLENCGKIMTENGTVSLDKGSLHFLRRADVESFVREGKVEQVAIDEEC